MSVVLKDGKNLRVNTAFGGILTAADVVTGRLLDCLRGIIRDMPLASLYFLEVVVLGH
jgi:hypothetical protein